ncbi:MAG: thioredoxin family protein [Polyangiaceae bacterium]|nr:thioredoxin family protein [Polyangiaceae bacterium]
MTRAQRSELHNGLRFPPTLTLVATLSVVAATGCGNETPQKEAPAEIGTDVGPVAPPRVPPLPAGQGESWNAEGIEWFNYASGLERAKFENKPICLVIYTTWCPHCKNYSRVFDDKAVAEMAKQFVMIRVEADQESDVAQKFANDGSYIPRTFFLSSNGAADYSIAAAKPKYRYFYDENNPQAILAAMSEAKRKLSK